jgi:hypothetical protein
MCDVLETKWWNDLHPRMQNAFMYGPHDPFKYMEFLSHVPPKIIRKMLKDKRFIGLHARGNVSSDEEADELINNIMSHASWVRETYNKSTELEELNNYTFIRHYGNKSVVIHWNKNEKFMFRSHAEFKNAHIDKFCLGHDDKTGNIKRVPLAQAWLKSKKISRFDYLEFLPGIEMHLTSDTCNLWRGWPFPINPNDSDKPPEQCALFLKHMLDNLCQGDYEVFEYLLGWMADAIINAHKTSEVAIVLSGPQGSGKTMWAKRFGELFYPHCMTFNKPEQLTGGFNKHLQDKSFILADEAFFAGNKKDAASLKTLITDDEIFIEPKGVDGFMAPKYFRVVIASNDEHVIRAEVDDRRYLVLNVDAGENNQNPEYFGPIIKQWGNGGAEALFNWFQGQYWRDRNASGAWNVHMRPKTTALNKQKDLSLPMVQEIIHQMLFDGELPEMFVSDYRGVFVATRLFAQSNRLAPKDITALGKLLHTLAGDSSQDNRAYIHDGHNKTQYRGYWLPELSKCRKNWEVFLKRNVEWPTHIDSCDVGAGPMPKEEKPF